MTRATLYACLLAGLTGINVVLFIASTRQLFDAMTERMLVERISGHLRNIYGPCTQPP